MNATVKPDDDVVTIDKFFGLRNTVGPESFELGDLTVATNVDVTDAQRIRRRKGYAAPLFVGAYDSLFADAGVMVARTSGTLYRLFLDATRTALRSGLVGDRLAYDSMGRRIFYSDGLVTGCIDAGIHRSWGIDPPSSQPAASIIGGELTAGKYQYAVTYLRLDGQESGTGIAGLIDVGAGSGISFTAIPVSSDPTVVSKRLYISPANGDKMYHVMTLAAATTSATYQTNVTGVKPLTTQFMQPPIAGHLVLTHHGRAMVARGSAVHYTPSFSPELMDLRQSIRLPSTVTLLAEVTDGIYIGTANEIVFLAGGRPEDWNYDTKRDYGAILGAVASCAAEDIDPSLDGRALLVGTTKGTIACLNGGKIINLTKERFQYPATDRGAGVVRGLGGMAQYLMVLEGTERAANTAF